MTSPLFREEALNYERGSPFGQVFLIQPLSHRAYVAVAVIALVTLASAAWTARYDRKATVPGHIASSKGIAKVYPQTPGTVVRMAVSPGDRVETDALLFTVESSRVTEGVSLASKLRESLLAQRKYLADELLSIAAKSAKDRRQLQQRTRGLNVQVAKLDAQIDIQQERLSLAERQLRLFAGLREKGYFADVQYQQQQDLALTHKQSLRALEQDRAQTLETLHATRAELERLPIQTDEQRRNVRQQLATLERQFAEVDASDTLEYRAPIAGRVAAILSRTGEIAQPNLPVVSIIPEHSRLFAKVYIPSRSAGFLQRGQRVKVRYAAFPHQRYGAHAGEISHIAQTLYLPQELPHTPISLAEPAYAVEVRLNAATVEAYGKSWPLQVGMALEAVILLDKRRFIDWLLDPLISLRGKFA